MHVAARTHPAQLPGNMQGRVQWVQVRNRFVLQTDWLEHLQQELHQSRVFEHQHVTCARGGAHGLASMENKNNP